jgi:ribosome-binding factor A
MSAPGSSRHDSPAARRLGERIKEIMGTLVPKLKDPRIGFVTITDVRMTADNERATIYYTVLPDSPEERNRTADGLDSAVGLLRRDLGKVLTIRHIPELVFLFDDVADSGRRIEAILADLDVPSDDAPGGQADEQGPSDGAGGAGDGR